MSLVFEGILEPYSAFAAWWALEIFLRVQSWYLGVALTIYCCCDGIEHRLGCGGGRVHTGRLRLDRGWAAVYTRIRRVGSREI